MMLADMKKANLTEADLSQSLMQGCDLTHADLTKTKLRGANLEPMELRDAAGRPTGRILRSKLRGALLIGTDFTGALCREVDSTDATEQEARFDGADLRGSDLGPNRR
jgi:uncharacterized protein YjbI with pentapeptide repeats